MGIRPGIGRVKYKTAPFQVMPLDEIGTVAREDAKSTASCRVVIKNGSSLSKGVKREREVKDDGMIEGYADCLVSLVSQLLF
jgi:hypothetical protein